MLISGGNLSRDRLKGDVAIVTGAGRGIGFETARALLWLGASVAIAEIDESSGRAACESLEREFGPGRALFVKTDIGDEKDIERLAAEVKKRWGKVDIVLNNATVFPMGAVKDTPIEKWDQSYRVNLKGPVLLARKFLSGMLERNHGTFVCVSSSGAAPYMGAYEVFKTAQGELATTIAAELEGTGVHAFTIGPGIVRTPGFADGGAQVASLMGLTLEDLLNMNKAFEISAEAAGTGFAAACALAGKYHGQETSSIQLLRDIGVDIGGAAKEEAPAQKAPEPAKAAPAPSALRTASQLYASVRKTYAEQSEGWKKRNLFERQWVARDFKKTTGMSIDEMSEALKSPGPHRKDGGPSNVLGILATFYRHQQDQLRGFEKDKKKLEANLALMDGWLSDIDQLRKALDGQD